jgi:hypothetical protein
MAIYNKFDDQYYQLSSQSDTIITNYNPTVMNTIITVSFLLCLIGESSSSLFFTNGSHLHSHFFNVNVNCKSFEFEDRFFESSDMRFDNVKSY